VLLVHFKHKLSNMRRGARIHTGEAGRAFGRTA